MAVIHLRILLAPACDESGLDNRLMCSRCSHVEGVPITQCQFIAFRSKQKVAGTSKPADSTPSLEDNLGEEVVRTR